MRANTFTYHGIWVFGLAKYLQCTSKYYIWYRETMIVVSHSFTISWFQLPGWVLTLLINLVLIYFFHNTILWLKSTPLGKQSSRFITISFFVIYSFVFVPRTYQLGMELALLGNQKTHYFFRCICKISVCVRIMYTGLVSPIK